MALIVVLATGTLASVSPEIDRLLQPAMRVTPRDGAMASWGAWATGAQVGAPGLRIERIDSPIATGFAVEALAVDVAGERIRVQVDPWTAKPLGRTPWLGARRLLRDLHRHLFLPGWIGLPLVTLLALPLLASLMTAFAVYKKWWRGFLRLPRGPRSIVDRRRFVGDLHRWGGLWTLPFLAVTATTGTYYLAEWAGMKAADPTLVRRIDPTAANGRELDRLVAIGRTAMPTLDVRAIEFPQEEEGQAAGGVRISGQASAWLVRSRANAVLLDGTRGLVVARVDGTTLTIGQRIGEAADPLHFGTWGGRATRWLWFVFGVTLTGLAVTGVVIYAMRLSRERGKSIGTMRALVGGMGVCALPAACLLGWGCIRMVSEFAAL